MTNSKRMAVHLLIMTIALGALTIHLVSAQETEESTITTVVIDISSAADASTSSDTPTTVTVDSGSSGATTQAPGGGQAATGSSETSTGALSTQATGTGAITKDGTSPESGPSTTQTSGTGTDGASQSTVSGTVAETTGTDTTHTEPTKPITTTEPRKPEPCICTTAPTVWEAHTALFLVIIIIGACCVALTSACCICMICYGRGPMDDDTCDCFGPRRTYAAEKEPISMEEGVAAPHHIEVPNPIPDAEIMKDEAPMLERENPAVTPNGGGQHISKNEDDNGWVVPLDELSSAKKKKVPTATLR